MTYLRVLLTHLLITLKKNEKGDWTIKEYDPRCEFCACRDCERMQQKDDLDEGVRDLMMEEDLTNKQKR